MTDASERDTGSPTEDMCAFVLKDTSTPALEEPWHCPHRTVEGHNRCVFHHTAAERKQAGISDDAVHRRFEEALESGDPNRREFVGATLPQIDFDRVDLDHEDQHLLDLRHACVLGDFLAAHARFEETVDLRDAKLDAFLATDASFSDGLRCERTTFGGEFSCYRTSFSGDDVTFTGSTFEGSVTFDQASIAEAARFDDAIFTEEASFLGADFHGRSVAIGDYTSFEGATFEAVARFDYARFEASCFEGTQFTDELHFAEATTTAPATFFDATFESTANFDGSTFEDDVSFATARFDGATQFQGVTFEGGGTVLHEDADFSGAEFADTVSFESGKIGALSFESASFDADACFRGVTFREQTRFDDAAFAADAHFDGAIFDDEVTFEGVTFAGAAHFPGVEFRGSNNHDSASVTFDDVSFEADANFHHIWCTSASFWDIDFGGGACFAEAKFTKHLDLKVAPNEHDTVVNFSEALLADGKVIQPRNDWVRCDLTQATLGGITFSVQGKKDRGMFEYLRFCDTTFDGFDFTAHAHFLTRSEWRLHAFDDEGLDYEYNLEMTPLAIEKTYQRAKTSASASGNVEASGKFRFKRQQYARQNYKNIARDPNESLGTRIRNGQRVGENLFLGVTCGHGMRLYRIAAMFIFFPIFPALLYTFGGPAFRTEAGQVSSLGELATMGGLETVAANIHFSYITFLTIGYGNVVAKGGMGLVLVSAEAYASVILGGLFIYVLVKRSEL